MKVLGEVGGCKRTITSLFGLYVTMPLTFLVFFSFGQECGFDFLRPTEHIQVSSYRTNNVHIIPTVVNIIHHSSHPYGVLSNITDEQVNSAIESLNYRLIGTPLRFCLIGINRTSSSALYDLYGMNAPGSGYTLGESESTIKGLLYTNRSQQYNIYVVWKINGSNGGGIQAYAYYPTFSWLDGTAILYNAFGTEGELKSYTNQNKTLVHEIGHAWGLYHTFNNTSSCSETFCDSQGDYICDTPPTIQNSSCSEFCPDEPIHNYMGYTGQTCRLEFTPQQIEVIGYVAENLGSRTTLNTSVLCAQFPICEGDVCSEAVNIPMCEIVPFDTENCQSEFETEGMSAGVGNCINSTFPTSYCPAQHTHFKNWWGSFYWSGGYWEMFIQNVQGFDQIYDGLGWTLWRGDECVTSQVVWGSSCSLSALCNPAIISGATGLSPWSPYATNAQVSGNLPEGNYYLEIWSKGLTAPPHNYGSGEIYICQPNPLATPPILSVDGLELTWEGEADIYIARQEWVKVGHADGLYLAEESGIYCVANSNGFSNFVHVKMTETGYFRRIYNILGQKLN